MRAAIAVAVLALGIGAFFRFYHVDQKIYGEDEVYTSLRLLGFIEAPLVRDAGTYHDAHDLWLVLHPDPPQGAPGPLAPVRALALEEPHHSPLYYVAAHTWAGIFGNSIAATRRFTALISLFALPFAFWLAAELFGSRLAGWIALILFALSPVYVAYAQEAREYSLWTVALLALSLALLRALERDRPANWWLFAALSGAALYVDPQTFLVLVGLFAYTLVVHRTNNRLVLGCGLSIAGACLAFVPWAARIVERRDDIARSLGHVAAARLSPAEIVRAAAGLPRFLVFDLNIFRPSRVEVVATVLVALLFACAAVVVYRRYPARVSLFLLCPILAATLPHAVADLFAGDSLRSPRYFISAYVYLDVLLAGFFAACLAARTFRTVAGGWALLAGLIAANLVSLTASSRAETWWNKGQDNSLVIARAIDATKQPIVVSDDLLVYSLVLANYLRPDVAVSVRPSCYLCADRSVPKLDDGILPDGTFSDVFALGPSPQLQTLLRDLIARRHLRAAYHCINVRNNCASDLNVEPVFAP